jgi:nitroreductase
MKEAESHPLDFNEKRIQEMVKDSQSFYQEIKRRRTVRQFSDRSVPIDIIENAIRAAGTAPNGANMQPWHFVVVSDPNIKREIRIAAEKEEQEFYQHRASEEWLQALQPLGTDEHKPFLEIAPYLIVIFLKKYTIDENGHRQKNYYPNESVGIATGMLITALHLSGLATLTHTPSPMKFLNSILDRPDHERPFLILVTGYPAKYATVPVITKYPLEKITTFL